MKLHLASGEVYILYSWTVQGSPASPTSIRGTGQLVGPERTPAVHRVHLVPLADVVLYETNTRMERTSGLLRGLGIATAAVCTLAVIVLLPFVLGGGNDH